MDYPMRPFIGNEEASLFYSAPDTDSGGSDISRIDEERGTVAHVRGYFDNSGEGLCTTFFGHNDNRLTTPKFTAELKKFMDSLRKDGPLQSVRTLRRFCAENGEGKLPDQPLLPQALSTARCLSGLHLRLRFERPARVRPNGPVQGAFDGTAGWESAVPRRRIGRESHGVQSP